MSSPARENEAFPKSFRVSIDDERIDELWHCSEPTFEEKPPSIIMPKYD
jgi:hypothetical protein